MNVNDFLFFASGANYGKRLPISKNKMIEHFNSIAWVNKLDRAKYEQTVHFAVIFHNGLIL